MLTAPDQSVPPTSLLYSWIDSTLAALKTDFAHLHEAAPSSRPSTVLDILPSTAGDFFSHYQVNPSYPVKLQHHLVQQAAKLRFNAAVEEVKVSGNERRMAHLISYSAPHAPPGRRPYRHNAHTPSPPRITSLALD